MITLLEQRASLTTEGRASKGWSHGPKHLGPYERVCCTFNSCRPRSPTRSRQLRANMRHRTHWFVQRKSRPRAALNSILIFVDQAAINVCFDFRR